MTLSCTKIQDFSGETQCFSSIRTGPYKAPLNRAAISSSNISCSYGPARISPTISVPGRKLYSKVGSPAPLIFRNEIRARDKPEAYVISGVQMLLFNVLCGLLSKPPIYFLLCMKVFGLGLIMDDGLRTWTMLPDPEDRFSSEMTGTRH